MPGSIAAMNFNTLEILLQITKGRGLYIEAEHTYGHSAAKATEHAPPDPGVLMCNFMYFF